MNHFEEVQAFRGQLKASGAGFVCRWETIQRAAESSDLKGPQLLSFQCRMEVRLTNGRREEIEYRSWARSKHYVIWHRLGSVALKVNREQALKKLKEMAEEKNASR